jgi:NADH-quinone oxidoreductase subunit L
MLVNRVGDVGLTLGICLIFLTFKTVDYATAFSLVPCVIDKTVTFFGCQFHVLTIISFLLF